MFRSPLIRTITVGLATGSMLVLAACGNDLKVSVSSQKPVTTSAPATTSGGGSATTSGDGGSATTTGGGSATTQPMGTVPGGGGTSADCLKFAQAWGAAIAGASTGGSSDTSVFDALVKMVPDKLKADAQLLANTYGKYLSILKSYNGDVTKAMSDPNVQKALQGLGSPEVSAAQQHISDYFDAQCPKG